MTRKQKGGNGKRKSSSKAVAVRHHRSKKGNESKTRKGQESKTRKETEKPKMGFRDSVHALLDTYAKCLDLLHRTGAISDQSSGRTAIDGHSRTALSLSLLDDQAKVQQAYASRLREAGSRLEKGDKRSRSVLRRIVRRLTAALASLFGLDSSPGGSQVPLTYHALRSLSNESRVGAIKTIDALSVRLSRSQSGRSTQTQRSSKTSRRPSGHGPSAPPPPSSPIPAAAPSAQRGHKGADKLHKQGAEKKPPSNRPHRDTRATPALREKVAHTSPKQDLPREPQSKKRPSPTTPTPAPGRPQRAEHQRPRQPPPKSRAMHTSSTSNATDVSSLPDLNSHRYILHPNRRISQISSSTASTKLGEIPEGKLRHHPQALTAGPADQRQAAFDAQGQGLRQYNVQPVYPVRPFHVPPPGEEEGRRRGFWGRFRKA